MFHLFFTLIEHIDYAFTQGQKRKITKHAIKFNNYLKCAVALNIFQQYRNFLFLVILSVKIFNNKIYNFFHFNFVFFLIKNKRKHLNVSVFDVYIQKRKRVLKK